MITYRKNKLREFMKKSDIEIILIYSNSENYAYHTALGNKKPFLFNYYFLTIDDEGILELDYLAENYQENKKVIPIKEQIPDEELAKIVNGKYKKIGICGDAPFWHLKKIKGEIVDINPEMQDLIMIKSEDEIKLIKESAREISDILKNVSLFTKKNEEYIKNLITKKSIKKGEGNSFPPCVKKWIFEKKSIVEIDAGIIKKGFYSDCTRMYFFNYHEAEENYKKLIKAHKEVIKKLKPGTSIKNLISIYREEIYKCGLPKDKLGVDDLGHSIGFRLHESLIFYLKEEENFKLRENMVITLEPWIDLGEYRVRVEDMVLIKENSEILTL